MSPIACVYRLSWLGRRGGICGGGGLSGQVDGFGAVVAFLRIFVREVDVVFVFVIGEHSVVLLVAGARGVVVVSQRGHHSWKVRAAGAQ